MDTRARYLVAGALGALAAASAAIAFARGELAVHLLLIIPLFVGSGPWGFLAMALSFTTFLALASASVARARDRLDGAVPETSRGGARAPWPDQTPPGPARESADESSSPGPSGRRRFGGGGVILIGPIPIVLGSDPRTTILIVGLTLALMVVVAAILFGFGGQILGRP